MAVIIREEVRLMATLIPAGRSVPACCLTRLMTGTWSGRSTSGGSTGRPPPGRDHEPGPWAPGDAEPWDPEPGQPDFSGPLFAEDGDADMLPSGRTHITTPTSYET
jgi:hypothetical protein